MCICAKIQKRGVFMATVGLIIDIAIVVALVIFGIIGFKKGFLKSIVSLFSWIVCLIVAVLTAKYVAGWINKIYDFTGLIGGKIAEGLTGTNEAFAMAINQFASKEEIVAKCTEGTNSFLAQLIKVIFNNTAVDMSSTDTVAGVLGASMGHVCMVIIAGVLVFVVLMIVVKLLSKLFDKIASTKILGGLNKILGLVFGLLKGGCTIIIGNCILIVLSLVPAINGFLTPIIQDNTHIERAIYNTTDKYVEEYIIEGELIQNWVNDLWDNRDSQS